MNGVGTFFDSRDAAVAAVAALQAKGTRSIDIGCMQVNLYYHPAAFATLDDAFDPRSNAAYAVRFLTSLYAQTRDWSLAAAFYHSQSPERGEDYQRRVFGRVMTPMGPPPEQRSTVFAALPPAENAYRAIPPPSLIFGAFAPRPPMLPAVTQPLRGQTTARR